MLDVPLGCMKFKEKYDQHFNSVFGIQVSLQVFRLESFRCFSCVFQTTF